MLSVIDFFCSLIWYFFLFLNKVLIVLFYCIFFPLKYLWNLICALGAFGRFCKKIEEYVKTIWKHSFHIIFEGIYNLYDTILRHISNSKKIKRIFAFFAIIIVALILYPPTHWGPWKEYQEGVASWYGPGFYWKQKADGAKYYPWDISAAHKEIPLGEIVKVKNLDNGKVVYVKIDDRGPYIKGRIIDMSYLAAKKLGMVKQGLANVVIYRKE